MTTDPRWHLLGAELQPAAAHVGPFPHAAFLDAVERAVGTVPSDIEVHGDDAGALVLVMGTDGIRLAGVESLTDYHAPLGSVASLLTDALRPHSGTRFRFDSLPEEATRPLMDALVEIAAAPTMERHDATAVLRLPTTFEAWLSSIGKKERHEVRRKRRRFAATFGEIEVVDAGPSGIDAFCDLHRTSAGEKGSFMTDTMQAFFTELATIVGGTVHHLVCGGVVRASAFGFETPDGYYYYNSAYDPDAAMASPGVVLFSSMIERQIERGVPVFDFLKGDEPYKYRHGAAPRPLFAIEGVIA